MIETTQIQDYRNQLRNHFLVTVSSVALLVSIALPQGADAADGDHPTVWVEVGGAFDQISNGNTLWLPPDRPAPIVNPIPAFGTLPHAGYDFDLKVSFTPEESDWIFSAAIRYGRAKYGPKHSHDQSYKTYITNGGFTATQFARHKLTTYAFANGLQKSGTSHTILDFQVGKDVGLGLFGGTGILSAGIRVVKFDENADGHLTAMTDAPVKYSPNEVGHKASLLVNHSFNGLGPSASWDGSVPFAGSIAKGFSFDWGANAAVLFGRQKSHIVLHTKVQRYGAKYALISHSTLTSARSRNVVVPNVGGFAGLSWRLSIAKVSLGYRGDFFFGAIDGGLATSQKETRGFYGPFASVRVGLGG